MVASAVLYVSCNKEQTQPKAEISEQAKFEQYVKEARQYANVKWEPNKAKSNKIAIAVDFTNPNNPFDYVGALHNQGLDYFINNYQNYPALIKVKNGKKEFSLHEMWKIVGNFGRDNNIQGLRQLTLNPHFRNAMNNDILNNFPNLETRMSTVAYNYLQQILNAMPNTLTPTCFTIPSRIDSAITMCVVSSKNIENNILNDTNLNAEEKVSLLCAASVARHSYTYWVSVWGDMNDKWWEIMGDGANNQYDARETANPDVGGAIWGAISYTGGTLVTGSSWSAEGCGWSALSGAVGASLGIPAKIGNFIRKLF